MDEGPILNEALGFGEASPDPTPRRVCDVWGQAHQWKRVAAHWWGCACGADMQDLIE